MKATELMIGNWVKIKGDYGKPLKITTIDDTYNSINYFNGDAEGELTLQLNEIEPIPITPEILEKNGFIRDPLWHHCDKDLDNYSISVQLGYANRIEYIKISEKGKDNVIPSERTKLYLTHIKYVHQLQHALRLCGIEKEIVL